MPRQPKPKAPPLPPPDLGLALEKMRDWRAKYRKPMAIVYPLSGLTAADVDVVLEAAGVELGKRQKAIKKLIDI